MHDNQQTLIKFPTITKLLYAGNPNQFQSNPRKTSTPNKLITSTSNLRQHAFYTTLKKQILNQKNNFDIVQLPQGADVMGISSMRMSKREFKVNTINVVPKTIKIADQLQEQKNKDRQENKGQKIGIKFKDKNRPYRSLNKIDLSAGQSAARSHTNFGHFTIQKQVDFPELYSQVIKLLAMLNNVSICKESNRIKKAKIQLGNNGIIIRQTIKRRSWWNTTTEAIQGNNISLVWTQHSLSNKKQSNETSYRPIQSDKDENNKQHKNMKFQRNFAQCLLFYPKILQLFFTDDQVIPKKLSPWLYNIPQPKRQIIPENVSIFNHLDNNEEITNKKMLFKNLIDFYQSEGLDPDAYIPKTYHLTAFNWQQTVNLIRNLQVKNKGEKNENNAWFLKPGQNTNRGRGIAVYKNLQSAVNFIIKNPPVIEEKTLILQKYISPLLYEGRKFDIRCFMVGVQVYNKMSYYWYEEGYGRTSSQKFSFKTTDKKIHLTNDAVQKNMENYGQYERGNKLSYSELDKYLRNEKNLDFIQSIVPKMKKIATHVVKSANRLGGDSDAINFQLFGLDYIVGLNGVPYLLEVNRNPSLEICCNLLSRIITEVLENTFRLVLDVVLPSPKGSPEWAQNFILYNKYSLIYRTTKDNKP